MGDRRSNDTDPFLDTGIEKCTKEKDMKLSPAVIFENQMCPICGNLMDIVSINVSNSRNLDLRFECNKCNFKAPMRYHSESLSIPIPVYDDSIEKFVKDFGQDPYLRIVELIDKGYDDIIYNKKENKNGYYKNDNDGAHHHYKKPIKRIR